MADSPRLRHESGITSLRNEWLALLECASPAHDCKRLAGLLRSTDWTRLLLLAREHDVTGHLVSSLRDLDENLVPAEIRQSLSDRRREQIFFTLRLMTELFLILERFAAEGIGALVVKGPVLSMQAYGDPEMRSYGDLDLLVRQRDIRRATELLLASGYQARIPLAAIDAGKIPGQYLFHKRDTKLLVELHNDFTLRYFPRRLPLDEFFVRQIRVKLDAHEVPALSPEDELVLICIHGAKHFWERLMWIADVAGLVTRQTHIDWERVMDSSKCLGAERMLHIGLRLAEGLLNMPLPERIAPAVQEDALAMRLTRQIFTWLPAVGSAPPSLLDRALFRMRMRGGLIGGPAYLLRLSLSPTEEDWQGETAEKPNWLVEAARRSFRLARKYSRNHRT